MSALEPGLYRATVRGQKDVTVFMDSLTAYWLRQGLMCATPLDFITDARPLIVLDLDSAEREYIGDLRYVADRLPEHNVHRALVHELADQIEAQTKPARILEPGWDGKVLAHTVTNPTRREFVRYGGRPSKDRFNWSDGQGFGSTSWDVLIDPILIREGVN